ncbi:DUF3817 domain-containing protein [Urechidicola croceus]|uniref:DUF3817 domain-containing protein n=1 Tax=Urechidicola croceus TaxID=1850246 RepID=A0A1D8P8J6_9FLAO|nr:DUF3817 domain-containing protein [Urechidicola croceus]AOW20879.1 hypothetical protein LPB138_09435 [Urechidicola croceus]
MDKLFRIVALLEGVSYLLLMFLGMPFKYLKDDPQFVKMFGMPHGLLFIGYVVLAFVLKSHYKWNNKNFFIVLLGSIIPFGTFYVDRKFLR